MKKSTDLSPNRVLIPIGIGLALSLFGDATLYTVLPKPEIAAQVGISLSMVGLLLGINRLARIASNGAAGALYDRLPRRKLMIASLMLGTISTMLYALGKGPALLLIGRIMWGFCWSGIWIGANTMALDISNEHNRGWINGRLQMFFLIGVAVTSLLGGIFTDVFGFRGGLWVSVGLTGLGVLVWIALLPETRPNDPQEDPEQNQTPPKEPLPVKLIVSTAVPLFAMRFVVAGIIASTPILWLSQFFSEQTSLFNLTIPLATLTGIYVAARVLISLLSAPAIGAISDQLKRRWSVVSVVLLIGTAGVWLMSLPNFSAGLTGAFLGALTAGSIPSLTAAIIGDQIPETQQSRALGLVYTIGDLGSAIAPFAGLSLIPLIGITRIYQFSALIYGLAGLFALWISLRNKTKSKQL